MNMRRIGAMIGSPGDAADERNAVTNAILQWNAHSGRSMNVFIDPVRWETHATTGLQGRPQGMINEELIPQSDMLIAMFHARAGSPTGVEVSGTIEEIREFMRQGKHVALYFYEGDVPIGSVDPVQLETIRNFQAEMREKGLTDSYTTVDELAAKIPHLLAAVVPKLIASAPKESGGSQPLEANTADPLPTTTLSTSGGANVSSSPRSQSDVVSDSGRWALLDKEFYDTQSVRQNSDGDWIVEVRSDNAEIDAHLSSLRPQQFGRPRPMPFAHRNDGCLVHVKSIESASEGDAV